MKKLTPEEVAAFAYRLTGGKPDAEITAKSFLSSAKTMRDYASKAAMARSGKYRGYTEDHALELAADLELRAILVPQEIKKLLVAA